MPELPKSLSIIQIWKKNWKYVYAIYEFPCERIQWAVPTIKIYQSKWKSGWGMCTSGADTLYKRRNQIRDAATQLMRSELENMFMRQFKGEIEF